MEEIPFPVPRPESPEQAGEVQFLGSGTYNCVFEYGNRRTGQSCAFRLSLFPKPREPLRQKAQAHWDQLAAQREEVVDGLDQLAQWPSDRPAGGVEWRRLQSLRAQRSEVAFLRMEEAKQALFFAERGLPSDYDEAQGYAILLQYRGRALLQWMQHLRPYIGPAMLETPEPWQAFDSVDEVAQHLEVTTEELMDEVDICETLENMELALEVDDVPYVWSLEKMELLTPWEPNTDMELRQHMFSFLWFFMTLGSSQLGGFRHHDVKPKNVMTRRYAQPQRFEFVYLPDQSWVFEASTMGVVIDLDFGTLDISQRLTSDRDELATLAYTPPEAFLIYFYESTRATMASEDDSMDAQYASLNQMFGGDTFLQWYRDPQRRFGADGYDQWSLGLTLIEGLPSDHSLPGTAKGQLAHFARMYEREVFASMEAAEVQMPWFTIRESKRMLAFFRSILLACAVHRVPAHNPFAQCPAWFPAVFFQDRQEIFGEAMQAPFYQELVDLFHTDDEVEPYRDLLGHLLAWNPQDRTGPGWLDDALWDPFVGTAEPPLGRPTSPLGSSWPPPQAVQWSPQEMRNLQARIRTTY